MTLAAAAGGKKKDTIGNLCTCAFPSGIFPSAGLAGDFHCGYCCPFWKHDVSPAAPIFFKMCDGATPVQRWEIGGGGGGINVTSTTSVHPSIGKVPSLQNLRFQVSSGRILFL